MTTVNRCKSGDELTAQVTADLVSRAAAAIAAQGRFSLALSGGNTPKPIYEALSRARVEWAKVHIYFGDERCVPPDHERSNYRMAKLALLDRVAIPAGQVHRMKGELEPARAAEEYARELEPQLDVVLLGLGDDGHTASLFPGLRAVHEQTLTVMAERVEQFKEWRLTLTPKAINAARHVAFVAAGAAKLPVIAEVLLGARDLARLPAQSVDPASGSLAWWFA